MSSKIVRSKQFRHFIRSPRHVRWLGLAILVCGLAAGLYYCALFLQEARLRQNATRIDQTLQAAKADIQAESEDPSVTIIKECKRGEMRHGAWHCGVTYQSNYAFGSEQDFDKATQAINRHLLQNPAFTYVGNTPADHLLETTSAEKDYRSFTNVYRHNATGESCGLQVVQKFFGYNRPASEAGSIKIQLACWRKTKRQLFTCANSPYCPDRK